MMSSVKTVVLQGEPTAELPDGLTLPVEVATVSVTIKNMVEEFSGTEKVIVPIIGGNGEPVSNNRIANVFDFYELLKANPFPEKKEGSSPLRKIEEQTQWEKDFFSKLSTGEIFEMLLLVNYLDIKDVLKCISLEIARQMKGKSPDEMRAHFTRHQTLEVK